MKFHKTKKIIAMSVALCFLCSGIGRAAPALPIEGRSWKVEATNGINELFSASNFELPDGLGTLDDFYISKKNGRLPIPFVFQIQTIHANAEAAFKIKELITYLNARYGVRTVFTEGASKDLHPEFLKFLPDRDQNQNVLNLLTQNGELTGVDLALADNAGLQTVGIEAPELYRKSYRLFRKVIENLPEGERVLEKQRLLLDRDASHNLTGGQRELIRQWLEFSSTKHDFLQTVNYLKRKSTESLALDFSDAFSQFKWPQMTRLILLQELEKRLNSEVLAQEKIQLELWRKENHIRTSLPFEGLLEEVQTSNRDDTRKQAERFLAEAASKGFRIRDYPQTAYHVALKILHAEIDSKILFKEISSLFEKLLEKEVVSDAERAIVEHYRRWLLLSKMLRLELTPEDWAEVKTADWVKGRWRDGENAEAIDNRPQAADLETGRPGDGGSETTDHRQQTADRRPQTTVIPAEAGIHRDTEREQQDPDAEQLTAQSSVLSPQSFNTRLMDNELSTVVRNAIQFYRLMDQREQVFFNKIASAKDSSLVMTSNSSGESSNLQLQTSNPVVLVTGGFHTPGMKERLRKNGIGYAVISPHIGGDIDSSLYHKIMLRTAHMEKPEFAQSAAAIAAQLPGDTAQLYLASELRAVEETIRSVVGRRDRSGEYFTDRKPGRKKITEFRSELRAAYLPEQQFIHLSVHSHLNVSQADDVEQMLQALSSMGLLHHQEIKVVGDKRDEVQPQVIDALKQFEKQKELRFVLDGAFLDDCCRQAWTPILEEIHQRKDRTLEIHFPVDLINYPHDFKGQSDPEEKIDALHRLLEMDAESYKLPFEIYVDGKPVAARWGDQAPLDQSQPARARFYLWSNNQNLLSSQSSSTAFDTRSDGTQPSASGDRSELPLMHDAPDAADKRTELRSHRKEAVRLNLEAIRDSLFEVQRNFSQINAQLTTVREDFLDLVLAGVMRGYTHVDAVLRTGVELNPRTLFNLNLQVHFPLDDVAQFMVNEKYVIANREKFDRYIDPLWKWYKRHKYGSPWKLAAGVYVRILARPQLFIEGNHRTGALAASLILASAGLPPFVLSTANAVAYFNLSSEIKFPKASSRFRKAVGMVWPEEKARMRDFLEQSADARFTLPFSENDGHAELRSDVSVAQYTLLTLDQIEKDSTKWISVKNIVREALQHETELLPDEIEENLAQFDNLTGEQRSNYYLLFEGDYPVGYSVIGTLETPSSATVLTTYVRRHLRDAGLFRIIADKRNYNLLQRGINTLVISVLPSPFSWGAHKKILAEQSQTVFDIQNDPQGNPKSYRLDLRTYQFLARNAETTGDPDNDVAAYSEAQDIDTLPKIVQDNYRRIARELISLLQVNSEKPWRVFMDGMPGTGKSTLLAFVLGELQRHGTENLRPPVNIALWMKSIADRRVIEDELIQGKGPENYYRAFLQMDALNDFFKFLSEELASSEGNALFNYTVSNAHTRGKETLAPKTLYFGRQNPLFFEGGQSFDFSRRFKGQPIIHVRVKTNFDAAKERFVARTMKKHQLDRTHPRIQRRINTYAIKLEHFKQYVRETAALVDIEIDLSSDDPAEWSVKVVEKSELPSASVTQRTLEDERDVHSELPSASVTQRTVEDERDVHSELPSASVTQRTVEDERDVHSELRQQLGESEYRPNYKHRVPAFLLHNPQETSALFASGNLTETEINVLKHRLGLDGEIAKTMEAVHKHLGISYATAGKAYRKAREKAEAFHRKWVRQFEGRAELRTAVNDPANLAFAQAVRKIDEKTPSGYQLLHVIRKLLAEYGGRGFQEFSDTMKLIEADGELLEQAQERVRRDIEGWTTQAERRLGDADLAVVEEHRPEDPLEAGALEHFQNMQLMNPAILAEVGEAKQDRRLKDYLDSLFRIDETDALANEWLVKKIRQELVERLHVLQMIAPDEGPAEVKLSRSSLEEVFGEIRDLQTTIKEQVIAPDSEDHVVISDLNGRLIDLVERGYGALVARMLQSLRQSHAEKMRGLLSAEDIEGIERLAGRSELRTSQDWLNRLETPLPAEQRTLLIDGDEILLLEGVPAEERAELLQRGGKIHQFGGHDYFVGPNARDWDVFASQSDAVDVTFEGLLTDSSVSQFIREAAQKRKEAGQPFTLLDWGAGTGHFLSDLNLEIPPFSNRTLIGFGRDFYAYWSKLSPDITMIFDDAPNLRTYFGENGRFDGTKIDFLVSHYGLQHHLANDPEYLIREVYPLLSDDAYVLTRIHTAVWQAQGSSISEYFDVIAQNQEYQEDIPLPIDVLLKKKSELRLVGKKYRDLTDEESQRLALSIFNSLGGGEAATKMILGQVVVGFSTRHTQNPFNLLSTGTDIAIKQVGPLVFVIADQLTPQAVTEIKRRLSRQFRNYPGNIILTEKGVYLKDGVDLGHYTEHMIAAMLKNADAFQNAVVTDFGAGNGVLSQVALKIGAQQVILSDNRAEYLSRARFLLETQNALEDPNHPAQQNFEFHLLDFLEPDHAERLLQLARRGDVVLVNIGPWDQYAEAHDNVIQALQDPNARWALLLNGGFNGAEQGHNQKINLLYDDFERAGADVALMILNQQRSSKILRVSRRIELRKGLSGKSHPVTKIMFLSTASMLALLELGIWNPFKLTFEHYAWTAIAVGVLGFTASFFILFTGRDINKPDQNRKTELRMTEGSRKVSAVIQNRFGFNAETTVRTLRIRKRFFEENIPAILASGDGQIEILASNRNSEGRDLFDRVRVSLFGFIQNILRRLRFAWLLPRFISFRLMRLADFFYIRRGEFSKEFTDDLESRKDDIRQRVQNVLSQISNPPEQVVVLPDELVEAGFHAEMRVVDEDVAAWAMLDAIKQRIGELQERIKQNRMKGLLAETKDLKSQIEALRRNYDESGIPATGLNFERFLKDREEEFQRLQDEVNKEFRNEKWSSVVLSALPAGIIAGMVASQIEGQPSLNTIYAMYFTGALFGFLGHWIWNRLRQAFWNRPLTGQENIHGIIESIYGAQKSAGFKQEIERRMVPLLKSLGEDEATLSDTLLTQTIRNFGDYLDGQEPVTPERVRPSPSIRNQRTLAQGLSFQFKSNGWFFGNPASLTIKPAPPGTGIVFVRTDLPGSPQVAAVTDNHNPVFKTLWLRRGTAEVFTAEHILAALKIAEIDNAFLELTSPEVPIMDGSALAFLTFLLQKNVAAEQSTRRKPGIKLKEPVIFSKPITNGIVIAYPDPSQEISRVTYMIDFGQDNGVGAQAVTVPLTKENAARLLAFSQTFIVDPPENESLIRGFLPGQTAMHYPRNAENSPAEWGSLRKDAPVLHKVLDFIGDMSLVQDIEGPVHFVVIEGGHADHVKFGKKVREFNQGQTPPYSPEDILRAKRKIQSFAERGILDSQIAQEILTVIQKAEYSKLSLPEKAQLIFEEFSRQTSSDAVHALALAVTQETREERLNMPGIKILRAFIREHFPSFDSEDPDLLDAVLSHARAELRPRSVTSGTIRDELDVSTTADRRSDQEVRSELPPRFVTSGTAQEGLDVHSELPPRFVTPGTAHAGRDARNELRPVTNVPGLERRSDPESRSELRDILPQGNLGGPRRRMIKQPSDMVTTSMIAKIRANISKLKQRYGDISADIVADQSRDRIYHALAALIRPLFEDLTEAFIIENIAVTALRYLRGDDEPVVDFIFDTFDSTEPFVRDLARAARALRAQSQKRTELRQVWEATRGLHENLHSERKQGGQKPFFERLRRALRARVKRLQKSWGFTKPRRLDPLVSMKVTALLTPKILMRTDMEPWQAVQLFLDQIASSISKTLAQDGTAQFIDPVIQSWILKLPFLQSAANGAEPVRNKPGKEILVNALFEAFKGRTFQIAFEESSSKNHWKAAGVDHRDPHNTMMNIHLPTLRRFREFEGIAQPWLAEVFFGLAFMREVVGTIVPSIPDARSGQRRIPNEEERKAILYKNAVWFLNYLDRHEKLPAGRFSNYPNIGHRKALLAFQRALFYSGIHLDWNFLHELHDQLKGVIDSDKKFSKRPPTPFARTRHNAGSLLQEIFGDIDSETDAKKIPLNRNNIRAGSGVGPEAGVFVFDDGVPHGSGGFGSVYRGTYRTMEAPVAIKVSHDPDNQQQRIGLGRAAEAARMLPPTYTAVVLYTDLKEGYQVTSFEEGKNLTEVINELNQDPDQYKASKLRLLLMILIGKGLLHLHDYGLIHRDFKPDNVIVQVKGGELQIKIIDLELAKHIYYDESVLNYEPTVFAGSSPAEVARSMMGAEDQRRWVMEDNAMTRDGALTGTPAYLAPQWVRGNLKKMGLPSYTPIDRDLRSPSTDLYAWAMTSWLLAVDTKFPGDDGSASLTVKDLIRRHALGNVPMPSERNPSIHPVLDYYIGRALQPAFRGQSNHLLDSMIKEGTFFRGYDDIDHKWYPIGAGDIARRVHSQELQRNERKTDAMQNSLGLVLRPNDLRSTVMALERLYHEVTDRSPDGWNLLIAPKTVASRLMEQSSFINLDYSDLDSLDLSFLGGDSHQIEPKFRVEMRRPDDLSPSDGIDPEKEWQMLQDNLTKAIQHLSRFHRAPESDGAVKEATDLMFNNVLLIYEEAIGNNPPVSRAFLALLERIRDQRLRPIANDLRQLNSKDPASQKFLVKLLGFLQQIEENMNRILKAADRTAPGDWDIVDRSLKKALETVGTLEDPNANLQTNPYSTISSGLTVIHSVDIAPNLPGKPGAKHLSFEELRNIRHKMSIVLEDVDLLLQPGGPIEATRELGITREYIETAIQAMTRILRERQRIIQSPLSDTDSDLRGKLSLDQTVEDLRKFLDRDTDESGKSELRSDGNLTPEFIWKEINHYLMSARAGLEKLTHEISVHDAGFYARLATQVHHIHVDDVLPNMPKTRGERVISIDELIKVKQKIVNVLELLEKIEPEVDSEEEREGAAVYKQLNLVMSYFIRLIKMQQDVGRNPLEDTAQDILSDPALNETVRDLRDYLDERSEVRTYADFKQMLFDGDVTSETIRNLDGAKLRDSGFLDQIAFTDPRKFSEEDQIRIRDWVAKTELFWTVAGEKRTESLTKKPRRISVSSISEFQKRRETLWNRLFYAYILLNLVHFGVLITGLGSWSFTQDQLLTYLTNPQLVVPAFFALNLIIPIIRKTMTKPMAAIFHFKSFPTTYLWVLPRVLWQMLLGGVTGLVYFGSKPLLMFLVLAVSVRSAFHFFNLVSKDDLRHSKRFKKGMVLSLYPNSIFLDPSSKDFPQSQLNMVVIEETTHDLLRGQQSVFWVQLGSVAAQYLSGVMPYSDDAFQAGAREMSNFLAGIKENTTFRNELELRFNGKPGTPENYDFARFVLGMLDEIQKKFGTSASDATLISLASGGYDSFFKTLGSFKSELRQQMRSWDDGSILIRSEMTHDLDELLQTTGPEGWIIVYTTKTHGIQVEYAKSANPKRDGLAASAQRRFNQLLQRRPLNGPRVMLIGRQGIKITDQNAMAGRQFLRISGRPYSQPVPSFYMQLPKWVRQLNRYGSLSYQSIPIPVQYDAVDDTLISDPAERFDAIETAIELFWNTPFQTAGQKKSSRPELRALHPSDLITPALIDSNVVFPGMRYEDLKMDGRISGREINRIISSVVALLNRGYAGKGAHYSILEKRIKSGMLSHIGEIINHEDGRQTPLVLEVPAYFDAIPEGTGPMDTRISSAETVWHNYLIFEYYHNLGRTRFLPKPFAQLRIGHRIESGDVAEVPISIHEYFQNYEELNYHMGQLRHWVVPDENVIDSHFAPYNAFQTRDVFAETVAVVVYHYIEGSGILITDTNFNSGDFIIPIQKTSNSLERALKDGSLGVKLITARRLIEHVTIPELVRSLFQLHAGEEYGTDEERFSGAPRLDFVVPALVSSIPITMEGIRRGLFYLGLDLKKFSGEQPLSDADYEEAWRHANTKTLQWIERFEASEIGRPYKPLLEEWREKFKAQWDQERYFERLPVPYSGDPREGDPSPDALVEASQNLIAQIPRIVLAAPEMIPTAKSSLALLNRRLSGLRPREEEKTVKPSAPLSRSEVVEILDDELGGLKDQTIARQIRTEALDRTWASTDELIGFLRTRYDELSKSELRPMSVTSGTAQEGLDVHSELPPMSVTSGTAQEGLDVHSELPPRSVTSGTAQEGLDVHSELPPRFVTSGTAHAGRDARNELRETKSASDEALQTRSVIAVKQFVSDLTAGDFVTGFLKAGDISDFSSSDGVFWVAARRFPNSRHGDLLVTLEAFYETPTSSEPKFLTLRARDWTEGTPFARTAASAWSLAPKLMKHKSWNDELVSGLFDQIGHKIESVSMLADSLKSGRLELLRQLGSYTELSEGNSSLEFTGKTLEEKVLAFKSELDQLDFWDSNYVISDLRYFRDGKTLQFNLKVDIDSFPRLGVIHWDSNIEISYDASDPHKITALKTKELFPKDSGANQKIFTGFLRWLYQRGFRHAELDILRSGGGEALRRFLTSLGGEEGSGKAFEIHLFDEPQRRLIDFDDLDGSGYEAIYGTIKIRFDQLPALLADQVTFDAEGLEVPKTELRILSSDSAVRLPVFQSIDLPAAEERTEYQAAVWFALGMADLRWDADTTTDYRLALRRMVEARNSNSGIAEQNLDSVRQKIALLQQNRKIIAPFVHIKHSILNNSEARQQIFESARALIEANAARAHYTVLIADTEQDAEALQEKLMDFLYKIYPADARRRNQLYARIPVFTVSNRLISHFIPKSAATAWIDWPGELNQDQTAIPQPAQNIQIQADRLLQGEKLKKDSANFYGTPLTQAALLLLEGVSDSGLIQAGSNVYVQQSNESFAGFQALVSNLRIVSASA
ncbi:MAG: UDP-3-O-acyl-N-acetylglucosamine deacetylase [Candidatus Omnitrophica bacterium]|nr:UDP-3-O-acyl-N-acetylglucosamine deacetylase [Candidatus Omnitrophota bacterium]